MADDGAEPYTDNPELSFFGLRVPAPSRHTDTLTAALSVTAWTAVGGAAIGSFMAQVPATMLTREDKSRTLPGKILRRAAVLACKVNPMWDFRIHGAMPNYVPGKTVVVSNHVSNSDPFLICHLPWEMKWLGKESLFKVPVVGWAMAMAGDVPVKRGESGSAKEAMRLCREHLDRGMPVMIFPEGTRSRSGELLPFKDGAFRLAIEAGADVLPLAVAGTRTALPKHSWRFGFSRGLVTVGEPISTTGMSKADVKDLKARARGQIEAMVAELAPLAG